MSRFRIRVTKSNRIGFGAGGKRAVNVRFEIKPLGGGSILVYEGNASGSEFINRCERLKQIPVIVESQEPSHHGSIHDWKKNIVRCALAEMAA